MLNRIFYISESVLQPGFSLQAEDNIFFSVFVNPLDNVAMRYAYQLIDGSCEREYGLTLNIQEALTEESLRFIFSFVMLPAYLRMGQQPVINLAAKQARFLDSASDCLRTYLVEQGVGSVVINKLVFEQPTDNYYPLRCPGPDLQQQYRLIFQGNQYYDNPVFFLLESGNELETTHAMLEKEESEFEKAYPKLADLARDKMALEKKLYWTGVRQLALEQELKNQLDYNALLRTDHSTRELQDYYNNEYEILPTWYKRFGHILKVVTGKRTLRSLFRDDVKKYKQ